VDAAQPHIDDDEHLGAHHSHASPAGGRRDGLDVRGEYELIRQDCSGYRSLRRDQDIWR
jgi:hypothetical protein